MRFLKIVGFAVLGMLPGVLLAVVPVLLWDLGFISSDASQIGFLGVPLAFIGLIVGATVGVSLTGRNTPVPR